MTTPPCVYSPPHFSLKPTNPPCPPRIYSQSNIKIKRKPVSGGYSQAYRTSQSPTLTSHYGLEGLEVVESHGPEVAGGDGLINMRDDDKHLSIQLPPGEEKIDDEEGQRRKKRICGMNVWVVIGLVIFLVIGAVVGGVVGALKGQNSTPEPIATPDSSATVSPTPTPKPHLPQPVDNTWYLIGTSNTSLSSNATGLYLTRDSGGAPTPQPKASSKTKPSALNLSNHPPPPPLPTKSHKRGQRPKSTSKTSITSQKRRRCISCKIRLGIGQLF